MKMERLDWISREWLVIEPQTIADNCPGIYWLVDNMGKYSPQMAVIAGN